MTEDGAAMLDQVWPDWWRRINLRKLDLANGEHCVLGQLAGGYFTGLAWLGLADGRRWGFDGPNSDELTKEWKAQILDRKFA